MKRQHGLLLLEIASPVVLIALLWVWTAHAGSFFFPPLEAIARAFANTWSGDAFRHDAVPSLRRWAAGFALSSLLGVAVGVPMGLNAKARQLLNPLIEFIRTTPPPALLPIAVIMLGIGDAMKVSMIVLVCVFPVLLSTADGIAEVHQTARDVARTYRIPFHAELFRILLPAAAARIFAGMRTSCSLALTMIVLSEMFGSTNGIGYQILASLRAFSIPEMWAGVVLIGLLGYLISLLFGWIERRALRALKHTDNDYND